MNKIRAIPTVYNGVRFRSRLEAKWAAFFDFVGWKWEYEPRDLAGWIPDFRLEALGAPNGELLIEVKPVRYEMRIPDAIYFVPGKIISAAPSHELLIVGESPCFNVGWGGAPNTEGGLIALGWMVERAGVEWVEEDDEQADSFSTAFMGFWSKGYGIRGQYGRWHDRISGLYEGNAAAEHPCSDIKKAWKDACNRVQWRPGDRT
ncbi:hypothetical protein [Burkholderia ubonensis]|uniref:hypothetical protein n=1 Tax=Burkholderia ubonensis TaxID=101571 RepID=UPI0011605691|nr:hypothetical protein [Burkholderia ubonensis]